MFNEYKCEEMNINVRIIEFYILKNILEDAFSILNLLKKITVRQRKERQINIYLSDCFLQTALANQ